MNEVKLLVVQLMGCIDVSTNYINKCMENIKIHITS